MTRFCHTRWERTDCKDLDANNEDAAYQAEWECYMLLIALQTWASELKQPCKLVLRGDAQGILQSIIKGSAKSPRINLMLAEVQLILAPLCQDVTGLHWWSEHNMLCDALSRFLPGQKVPIGVHGVVKNTVPKGPCTFLRSDVRNELGYNKSVQ